MYRSLKGTCSTSAAAESSPTICIYQQLYQQSHLSNCSLISVMFRSLNAQFLITWKLFGDVIAQDEAFQYQCVTFCKKNQVRLMQSCEKLHWAKKYIQLSKIIQVLQSCTSVFVMVGFHCVFDPT